MRRADKLNHIHVLIVLKSGSLNLLEPSGPVQACNGIALTLPNTSEYFVGTSSVVYRYVTNNTPLSLRNGIEWLKMWLVGFEVFKAVKVKAIPLQAWTGPEGSSRLRLPDFKKIST